MHANPAKWTGAPLLGLVAAACASAESSARREETIQFAHDIRPILSANCFACHGPDEEHRPTELRFDVRESSFADLGGYRAIVPGKPQASELYRRIQAADEAERMPPADSGKKLTDAQIAVLKRWIEQGAAWQEHWSFIAPVRPPLPPDKADEGQHAPIDRFISARLDAEGLTLSPEADRRTLIRRVTFDLTGLPPRLDDVRAFVADSSPNAYEKVVDRLLASVSYGEHMARFWLDAVRYGDTHGLHLDNYREMWPYRDWIIRAFNSNMPYDQFLIEQLAGDLLTDATLERQVATGFSRCHPTTNEGGSIVEEVYVRNVVDRVSTVGTAFMGLTLGCAVCHDHKFDPVSQKEFYELFAFFNNLDGSAMDGNVANHEPTVRVPNEEQAEELAALGERIAQVRALHETRLQADDPAFRQWVDEMLARSVGNKPNADLDVHDDLLVHCKLDEGADNRVLNSANAQKSGTVIGESRWIDGQSGGGLLLVADSYANLGNVGDFKLRDSFSFGAWICTSGDGEGPVMAKMEGEELMQGYGMTVLGRSLAVQLYGRWPMYGIRVTTKRDVLKRDSWHHVFVTYDGSRMAQGVKLYVDGAPQPLDVSGDSLRKDGAIESKRPFLLGRDSTRANLDRVSIDDVRIYDRRLPEADVRAVMLSGEVSELLRSPSKDWTDQQLAVLRNFYMLRYDSVCNELSAEMENLWDRLDAMRAKLSTTPIFRERRQPRDAFVLIRGEYDRHGEKVSRRTPRALPPMSEDLPRDRLGLAKWLISSEHPLTSRVAVNRFWQQVFGVGLVKTADDFGNQGSPPSHPQLLDWLAVEFRESGWDLKAILKQIAMSATYRQSSRAAPALIAKDPENRLFARGPRFRLDAEMLRDQALAVSGLLVRRIGGPSVKPPQPAGLWKAVGYANSNTVEFRQDTGPDKIHRRSVYTFWKRTAPPPQMATFDAPSRESCIVRRERTNTPLQALLLMNEPQYFEAARHFAERILNEAPKSSAERARWAFEHVTSRPADPAETDQLVSAYRDYRSNFESKPEASEKVLTVGDSASDTSLDPTELASWTMVANLLFNLDEFVTKE